MDLYHITLFIHIVALVVAGATTAIVTFAIARRSRARTLGDVMEWHGVLSRTARLFPICLLVLLLTGGAMLGMSHAPLWNSGFVVAGLTGVGLLFASGGFLGSRAAALGKVLDEMAKRGLDQPAPKLVPPPLVALLPSINTWLAMAVVFDMVTKPLSIPVALGVLAIGIAIGGVLGMRRPAAAASREEARAA